MAGTETNDGKGREIAVGNEKSRGFPFPFRPVPVRTTFFSRLDFYRAYPWFCLLSSTVVCNTYPTARFAHTVSHTIIIIISKPPPTSLARVVVLLCL